VIKKIEHFWKGLSNDKKGISAQPPDEYGERFLKFMSGITMSAEAAAKEAEQREREAQAAAEEEKTKERIGSWSGSVRRKSTSQHPPAPTHQPPAPPITSPASGEKSPEVEALLRKGEYLAQKSPKGEERTPEMTLKTTAHTADAILPAAAIVTASTAPRLSGGFKQGPQTMPHSVERRESTTTGALPILEEAGEGSSVGDPSRNSHLSSQTAESEGRPLTPAKDGAEFSPGFASPVLSHGSRNGDNNRPTVTPKPSYLKPESADSGYGVSRSRSNTAGSGAKVKMQLSRESLDKALPPLPKLGDSAAAS